MSRFPAVPAKPSKAGTGFPAGLLAVALLLPGVPAAAETPGDGHHPAMAKATAAFHELMEPLWHMPPGTARAGRACANAMQMEKRLRAMTTEHGPKVVLGQMADSVKGLAGGCKASKNADIEKELEALHHQFHQLMGM